MRRIEIFFRNIEELQQDASVDSVMVAQNTVEGSLRPYTLGDLCLSQDTAFSR